MDGEGKGKGKGNTKGKGGGEGKGKGEGGGEDRVKAYGNITVSMIMQRSFIRCSYWLRFVQHKKEIFSQKLRSSADKAWRKKNRSKS